jgi:hypothetical protein
VIREKLKRPEGKKFLLAIFVVFCVALTILIRATIGGVVEEYNMPLSTWTTQMYLLQGAMVLVYTLVLTLIFSLPLGFYFFGEKSDR